MTTLTITDILQTMDYGPNPESDAAQAWLDGHQRRFGHFIGGRGVRAAKHFDSLNPATGARAGAGGARHAGHGRTGREGGRGGPARVATNRRPCPRASSVCAGAALQKHARLFAVLESLDNGKPIRETRDIDVPLAVRHFYHHAGWAQLLDSEFPQHRAVGVVGQIVPWNFPLLMLAWKIAPALACGNTVVFKPAEQTADALLFAEICDRGGPARRRGQHRHRRRRGGCGDRRPSHRQDRLHRQHRGRPASAAPPPAAARS
jgi:aldehyde dehydrogenase (NAD+)